jgi:hypothetical protein
MSMISNQPKRINLGAILTLTPLVLVLMILATVNAQSTSAGIPLEQGSATTALPTVLVELFTSEGCSTCPPADKLLTDLDQIQPVAGVQVIALSEHVDYWDRLGWTDRFSSVQFSERQGEYSRALGGKGLFTPEMIVDGRTSLIGGKVKLVLEAIAEAARSPKAEVSIAIQTSGPKSVALTTQVEKVPDLSPGDKAEVMLAITESGLVSSVSRGENSGRQLAHSAVTRKLIKLGTVESQSFSGERVIGLESSWKRENMKAVAFVQERSSRRVLGATAIKLQL